MRKTLNINLGGLAFIIDENAFDLLHTYLEALKRKFNNEAERDEILSDIETRIAELLNQKLTDRREVVSSADVQAIMDALGKPEDIAGEETPEQATGYAATPGPQITTTPEFTPVKKRLFRDPDDAKIGGVISGLCHYFGVNDPIWVRIAAIALLFLSFFSIAFLYLILLVIVPKATTAAEKLQMKGEPININTIEKEIKDAAGRATESVHNLMREQNVFQRFWDILVSLLKATLKIFSVFFIIIALVLLVVVVALFFALYVLGTSELHQAANLIVSSPSSITIFSFGFLLFFGIPVIGLIYASLKVLLGGKPQDRWLKTSLTVLWLAGVVLLLTTGYKIGSGFKESGTVKHQSTLMQPLHGNLCVQLTDSSGRKLNKDDDDETFYGTNIDEDGIRFNGIDLKDLDLIPLGKPSLQLMPSENDSFYVQEVLTSQGRNKADAERNADMVIYAYTQADTTLQLHALYYIGKTAKYRAQDIKIRVAVPEGKKISFADNMDIWHATVKGDNNYDDTYFANTTWTVENGKVKCIAGENHKYGSEGKTSSRKKNGKTEQVENTTDKTDADSDSDDKEDEKETGKQDY